MMKIYKVEQRMVDCCEGRFAGYKELGYYTTKERAEQVKANAHRDITHKEVEIIEIEVNE